MGVLFGWFGQNISVLIAFLTGGAILSTFRFVRKDYERAVATRGGKVVRMRNLPEGYQGDGAREYTGLVFRVPGYYRLQVVNIKHRVEQITIDGVERYNDARRLEKWKLQGAIRWHIMEGYVYSGCLWQIDDLGEYVRSTVSSALHRTMVDNSASQLMSDQQLYGIAEAYAHEDLKKHGVAWSVLMIREFARVDAEVQAQAIDRASQSLSR